MVQADGFEPPTNAFTLRIRGALPTELRLCKMEQEPGFSPGTSPCTLRSWGALPELLLRELVGKDGLEPPTLGTLSRRTPSALPSELLPFKMVHPVGLEPTTFRVIAPDALPDELKVRTHAPDNPRLFVDEVPAPPKAGGRSMSGEDGHPENIARRPIPTSAGQQIPDLFVSWHDESPVDPSVCGGSTSFV